MKFVIRLATYGLAELQVEGDGNCQVCESKQLLVFETKIHLLLTFLISKQI